MRVFELNVKLQEPKPCSTDMTAYASTIVPFTKLSPSRNLVYRKRRRRRIVPVVYDSSVRRRLELTASPAKNK
ncbi:hypothetical protein EVAR_769_1 [Eumeta japonica]|uniref:Uncharacterized protein n=1 Tax=Eumeta variegata TaxID=151549 RepID=A0A4C1SC84_EUMVA|nr:hypothetical protein EVAR_769_1 [Eumeta japonica]